MQTTATDQLDRLQCRLAEIEARLARRSKRIASLNAEQQHDHQDQARIEQSIRRERLKTLIGVPDAVRIGYRYPAGHQCAKLNDALGTILEIGRTRAVVLFRIGDTEERWQWHLENLKFADELQGMTF
jgi:NADH:ubiquinone oxidoreductase subunit D